MIANILSPERYFKRFMKSRIPQLRADLSKMIEALLLNIADEEECNPFELALILSKRDNLALGRVVNAERKILREMDAGAIIQDLFLRQIAALPEAIKEMVVAKLGDEDVNVMTTNSLTNRSLVIKYNQDYELMFVEVTKEGSKILDLDKFFNNLKF